MEDYRRKMGKPDQEQELVEKVIKIDRITKVVKGGKRLAFRAFVIVGNRKGKVGFGLGKSKEVPVAIKKAIERAKKRLESIQLVGGTLPHQVLGKFGASRVILKPAKAGRGVIAGGSTRILLEALGVKDVVAKSKGSNNPINAAQAAMEGLRQLKNLENEEKLRGKTLPVFFENVGRSKNMEKEPVVVGERVEEAVNKQKVSA